MQGADWNVVPADVVVFEMGFQPSREATFAGGHPAHYARKDGDEVRHAKLSPSRSVGDGDADVVDEVGTMDQSRTWGMDFIPGL